MFVCITTPNSRSVLCYFDSMNAFKSSKMFLLKFAIGAEPIHLSTGHNKTLFLSDHDTLNVFRTLNEIFIGRSKYQCVEDKYP